VISAEDKRRARIAAMSDDDLVDVCLAEREAYSAGYQGLLDGFRQQRRTGRPLSARQRQIAEECAVQVVPLNAKEVPVGKPVPTPTVLLNLPKKPPGRK